MVDKLKLKSLDDLIAKMTEMDASALKKHPKLMAAKITVEKPMDKMGMKPDEESAMEDKGEEMPMMDDSQEHEDSEQPESGLLEEFEKLPEEIQIKMLKKIMR